MSKIIAAVNAGSSSVKVSIFEVTGHNPRELAIYTVEGLPDGPAKLKRTDESGRTNSQHVNVRSHRDAFKRILDQCVNYDGLASVTKYSDISTICHRIVHGGDLAAAQPINAKTLHILEQLSDLAPLHNEPALEIVRFAHNDIPSASNVAFFDTSFHASMPLPQRTYAIDRTIAQRNRLCKYGFHGLSYAYIIQQAAAYLSQPVMNVNLIALHLGSGASACAIRGGSSFDTSMGLTPLDGLPGATRSGSIDPSLVFHYTHTAGAPSIANTREMYITEAERILNQDSGWKALTGTADFGEISSKAADGDSTSRLAFDIFVDRIVGFVASYFVRMEGKVHALVFAGGVGERGSMLRETVVQKCSCLGFTLDQGRNRQTCNDTVVEIGQESQEPRILLVRTNEQLQMINEWMEKEQRASLES